MINNDVELQGKYDRGEISTDCFCKLTGYAPKNNKARIDPVCILHGKKASEHEFGFCLYCCLCWKTLTPDTCHVKADGVKEDVCKPCAKENR